MQFKPKNDTPYPFFAYLYPQIKTFDLWKFSVF